MKLLKKERVISESDNKEIVLTTHRVRHNTRKMGKTQVTSIMLDELDSCEIRSISSPILMWLAVISALGGLLLYSLNRNNEIIIIGIVVGLIFAMLYNLTRTQVISLKSSSSVINLRTAGMSIESAKSFIDSVESAKQSKTDSASA